MKTTLSLLALAFGSGAGISLLVLEVPLQGGGGVRSMMAQGGSVPSSPPRPTNGDRGCDGCGAEGSTVASRTARSGSGDVCPVSGQNIGSMGEPVTVTYDGTRVRLCCPGCVKMFEEAPARYVAQVLGDQGKSAGGASRESK